MTLLELTHHSGRSHSRRAAAFALAALACLALAGLFGCGDDDEEPNPIDPGPDPNAAGIISTWAGDGRAGYDGDGNALLESSFYWPADMLWTSDGTAYILDWNNHRVRRVTSQNKLETVIGDFVGDGPPDQSDLTPEGAPGTSVSLNHPTDLSEMEDGKLLMTAWHNHKLRTFTPSSGLVHVYSGNTPGFVDNVVAKDGRFNQPVSSVIAEDGTIYTIDQRNQRIRKISGGMITTVVGTGVKGFNGDGAPLETQISQPTGTNPTPGGGIALDAQGRLYFSDIENERVRRVDFTANTVETIAGTGEAGYSGDGGPGNAAKISHPRDLEIKDGILYIAEEGIPGRPGGNVIRAVDLTTGIISTIAGTGEPGYDENEDGNFAVDAKLQGPTGIAFGPDGDLYIADALNHRLRKVNF